jgi:hypothetical protein
VSGHLRSGFAAFLLVAGFSTPAASNALTDLFSPNPAPEAATAAAAPPPEECARQPGSTSAGQRWVYRYDGHRKCWFQAEETSALTRKPARHRVARRSVTAPEEDKPAPRQQKDVEDARAELLSSAPEQTPQPAPSVPKLTIVHTVPVRVADAAGQVPPAPVLARRPSDQLTPDQPAPLQVDVESLLAKAPAASDEVASTPPARPVAAPGAQTGGGEDWMASWLGALLMALGGAALLSSSGTLRRALWPVRFPESGTERSVIAHGGRNDLSFGRSASHRPAPGEASFSTATRRVGPRTARARRPLSGLPSH